MNTITEQPMCVKQLAEALGRHASFVYKMRLAGFVMRFDSELRCEAATVSQAREWLRATGFRVVNGRWEIRQG